MKLCIYLIKIQQYFNTGLYNYVISMLQKTIIQLHNHDVSDHLLKHDLSGMLSIIP